MTGRCRTSSSATTRSAPTGCARCTCASAGTWASNALDANTTWWRPDADNAPRDPLHPVPNDPQAWREFVVEDLEPFHLALTNGRERSGSMERTYRFDPRTTTAAPQGLPTAGVLTMMGAMSSFPRERVRAARFLEMFACQSFSPPPADVHFPPLENDPGDGRNVPALPQDARSRGDLLQAVGLQPVPELLRPVALHPGRGQLPHHEGVAVRAVSAHRHFAGLPLEERVPSQHRVDARHR